MTPTFHYKVCVLLNLFLSPSKLERIGFITYWYIVKRSKKDPSFPTEISFHLFKIENHPDKICHNYDKETYCSNPVSKDYDIQNHYYYQNINNMGRSVALTLLLIWFGFVFVPLQLKILTVCIFYFCCTFACLKTLGTEVIQ